MPARKIFYHIIIVSIISLSFNGCIWRWKKTQPIPALENHEIEAALNGVTQIYEFKGFGNVSIVAAGQNASGSIDAVRRNTGFVSAQIYTPFGSAIAAINATDSVGNIAISRQERIGFAYNDFMSSVPLNLPFPTASRLTFGEFFNVITASMPNIYWNFLQTPPDTLSRNRRRNTVTASWITDTLTVRAQISQKTKTLDNIAFNYDFSKYENGNRFSFRFSRFNERGVPREITIRESARNFITIIYDDVQITEAHPEGPLQMIREPRPVIQEAQEQTTEQTDNEQSDGREQ